MKFCKKALAIVLVVMTIFTFVPMTALADSVQKSSASSISVGETKKFAAYYPGVPDKLTPYVKNLDSFRDYLFNQFYKSNKKISIASYKIPFTQAMIDALWALKEDEMMEIFHVKQIEVFSDSKGRYLDYIQPTYTYSASKYTEMITKAENSAAELLEGIQGNSALGQVEKALLLHDRLALLCDYEYLGYTNGTASEHIYDMYGVFVDKKAVCQGYAEAYDYLLEKVGIESEICTSNKLNHAWNIVTIAGVKYHVDVTWDDPINTNNWDVQGEVLHNNFLLSSNALFRGVNGSQGHNAYDYQTTPQNTKYDNYFWQRSDTAFQLIGNEIYYMDNDSAQLKKYSNKSTLVTINGESDKWPSYPGYNFSRLTSDGKYLYFSTAKYFYGYDPSKGELVRIHTPSLSSSYLIYGFEYVGNKFIYDTNINADFSNNRARRNYFNFDIAPPTLKATSTYGATTSQTITLTMDDNSGIAGYWLGNNKDYKSNTFYSTSSKKVTIKITNPGTYYIVVKDTFGNVSELMHYFTYSKITLNANSGTVSPGYIISVNNYSVNLPTPSKPGYVFKGWATSKTATSGVKTLKPTANKTYYAIWKVNTSPSLYNVNGVWYYYVNGKINKSNTLVNYNNNWYHVNGGKWVKDTTLVKFANTWYYVKNGVKNNSNTLVKFSNNWYHVNGGKLVKDTTLVKFGDSWYYVKNGVKNNSNTLVKYGNNWYHVKGGKWVKDTTLVKFGNAWYYVKNGVKNSSNTLVKFSNKWYHVNGGKWVKDTAIVKFSGKRYYVKGGIVQNVTKTVKIGGKYYRIKKGVVS